MKQKHIPTKMNIDRIKQKTKPICKVLYYLFIVWVLVTGTVGTYAVLSGNGAPQDYSNHNVTDYRKKELLDKEVLELYRELGEEYSITLYKVTLRTAYNPELVDVISSVGGPHSKENARYWQNQSAYKGYSNLNKEISEKGYFYTEDIRNNPEIYQGRAKVDIDNNKTKSVYGLLVSRIGEAGTFNISIASTGEIDIAPTPFYLNTRQSVKNIAEILKE